MLAFGVDGLEVFPSLIQKSLDKEKRYRIEPKKSLKLIFKISFSEKDLDLKVNSVNTYEYQIITATQLVFRLS